MIRFINPNYHVILIHYPLALLGVGLLIELLCMFIQAQSLRVAGCWMILLGAFACAPAATSGIFAKYDILSQMGGGQDSTWSDTRAHANLSALQWELLNRHVLYTSVGSGLAVIAAMFWLAVSARWPARLGVSLWVIFAVAMGVMVVGAGGAGEMVYRTQISTKSQAASDKLQDDWNRQVAADSPHDKLSARVDYYIDPLQAHIIGAGIVAALIAAAWGTSIQKSTQLRVKPLPRLQSEDAQPAAAPEVTAPATALWILATLAALGVLAVGWYIFCRDFQSPWNVAANFREAVMQPYQKDPAGAVRVPAHLLFGGAIVVLAALLILAARWGARSRLLIGFLGLVILAALAAQIWVGILMLYDSNSGPLTHFNAVSNQPSGPALAGADQH